MCVRGRPAGQLSESPAILDPSSFPSSFDSSTLSSAACVYVPPVATHNSHHAYILCTRSASALERPRVRLDEMTETFEHFRYYRAQWAIDNVSMAEMENYQVEEKVQGIFRRRKGPGGTG